MNLYPFSRQLGLENDRDREIAKQFIRELREQQQHEQVTAAMVAEVCRREQLK